MGLHRMKILVFVSHYLPGHKSGGPVRTIANMTEALGDQFEFRIITSDRDLGDETSYTGITVDHWNRVGKGWVYYASPNMHGLSLWLQLIRDSPHDVLYLNSLFSPFFTLLPLLIRRWSSITSGKPIIVAPRGELSPGALQLKSHKKAAFLRLAKRFNLYSDVLWHASTVDEQALLLATFGESSRIHVARDLPASVPPLQSFTSHQDHSDFLRVAFVSRISKMKNLDFALRILARSRLPIRFQIWGPVEDQAHWGDCQGLMESLPKNIQAQYCGILDHEQVNSVLSQYDLFFLPTRGENYGHVIAEALSAGTPVLISNETPWRHLDEAGVGWDLALTNESGFLNALDSSLERVKRDRLGWRRQVHDYAVKKLTDPDVLEANRQLFYTALMLTRLPILSAHLSDS